MRIVVTSASGANGNGRGTLLAFDLDGRSLGPFAPNAGIVDPRGLHLHADGRHLYVNNGDDRALLLDERGAVVASTASIERLNPGGGVISPDGRYCVTARTLRTIVVFSADLSGPGVPLLPDDVVAFPRGLRFAPDGRLFCVTRDEVVAFDFDSAKMLGAVVRFDDLHGQALAFFPGEPVPVPGPATGRQFQ